MTSRSFSRYWTQLFYMRLNENSKNWPNSTFFTNHPLYPSPVPTYFHTGGGREGRCCTRWVGAAWAFQLASFALRSKLFQKSFSSISPPPSDSLVLVVSSWVLLRPVVVCSVFWGVLAMLVFILGNITQTEEIWIRMDVQIWLNYERKVALGHYN